MQFINKNDTKVSVKAIVATFVLATMALAFDLSAPFGSTDGVSYVALVLISALSSRPLHTYVLAGLSSFLVIIGYFASPQEGAIWVIPMHRGLALLAIWIAAVLISSRQKYEISLLLTQENLEHKVTARTAELKAEVDNRERVSLELKSILENMSDAIYRTDVNGILTMASQSTMPLIGYELDELIGTKISEYYIDPNGRDEFISKMHAGGGKVSNFKAAIRHKDGRVIWVSTNAHFILDDHNAVIGVEGWIRDITDLNMAEQIANDANKARSEFLASMTHELRTPLNAIIGFSDMIQSEIFGPIKPNKYLEYAKDINSSGNYLLSLVNEVLNVAKIEAGEFTVYSETTDFSAILHETLAMLKGLSLKAGVSLRNDVPTELPLVMADRRTTKQLLINLITNAIKFTPKGGDITARASLSKGMLSISITDTGTGMSHESIKNAMRPFVQVGSRDSNQHGTGLGLPLCKKFAELQGGEFNLKSELGKGTTATFTLPISDVKSSSAAGVLVEDTTDRLTWIPSMGVGIDVWDSDHRELFKTIKVFKDAVDQQAPYQELEDIFSTLYQSMEIHMRSEERTMLAMDYPGYEEHKTEHDKFRTWVAKLKKQCQKSPENWSSAHTTEEVIDWWHCHVIVIDRLYVDFFENQKIQMINLLSKYKGIANSSSRPTSSLTNELIVTREIAEYLEPTSWLPSMSIGVDEWDEDHRTLLSFIDRFCSTQNGNIDLVQAEDMLKKLTQYAEIHLSSEESVMKSMGYPSYEEHKTHHNIFRDWLSEQKNLLQHDPNDWDPDISREFLVNWLFSHILKVDMDYKAFFESRRDITIDQMAKYKGVRRSLSTAQNSTHSTYQIKVSRPLHILVAEDDKLNQKVILAHLTSLGHTIEIAENGALAVERYKNGCFDLILMDIRMPKMSGFDATRAIRQFKEDKATIPIIALTADEIEGQKTKYLDAGFNKVTTKPINLRHLTLVMNAAMNEEIHVNFEANIIH